MAEGGADSRADLLRSEWSQPYYRKIRGPRVIIFTRKNPQDGDPSFDSAFGKEKHLKNVHGNEDNDLTLLLKFFREKGVNDDNITVYSKEVCIEEKMEKEANDPRNEDCDSFFFIFLTFGNEKLIQLGSSDYEEKLMVTELMEPLKGNCHMTLKPKIFIIQADDFSKLSSTVVEHQSGIETKTHPLEADFLLLFSTIPGILSWWISDDRKKSHSHLIQAFVDVLTTFPEEDIYSLTPTILGHVQNKIEEGKKTVKQKLDSLEGSPQNPSQRIKGAKLKKVKFGLEKVTDDLPRVTSTLTKMFYFCKNPSA